MEDQKRKYIMKKIYSTVEEMNKDTATVYAENELAYVSGNQTLYTKTGDTYTKFDPVTIKQLEANNMIIKVKDMKEFAEKVSAIPPKSRIYVEETNTIWRQNDNFEATMEGTPEKLGIKIL
jgi:hypothetical protein